MMHKPVKPIRDEEDLATALVACPECHALPGRPCPEQARGQMHEARMDVLQSLVQYIKLGGVFPLGYSDWRCALCGYTDSGVTNPGCKNCVGQMEQIEWQNY